MHYGIRLDTSSTFVKSGTFLRNWVKQKASWNIIAVLIFFVHVDLLRYNTSVRIQWQNLHGIQIIYMYIVLKFKKIKNL
jgi:hypothetical protein